MLISVVIPVYGSPKVLPALYERLVDALTPWTDFELVMVNDCCPFGSGQVLAELAAKDPRVKFIDFLKNYGQHTAITAGLDHARGDYAVVMDCDLQDQPEEIKTLYDRLVSESYEAVFGIRAGRQHGRVQRFESRLFAVSYNLLAQGVVKTNNDIGNFSIISRKVVNAYRLFREEERLYGIIISRILPEIGFVDIPHAQRQEGKSSYTFYKRARLAYHTLIYNSTRPLVFAIYFAFVAFAVAAGIGLKTFFSYYIHGVSISGWTSLMLVLCFFSGLQMLFMGILGAYLGTVSTAVKRRPLYLVTRSLNIEDRSAADGSPNKDGVA